MRHSTHNTLIMNTKTLDMKELKQHIIYYGWEALKGLSIACTIIMFAMLCFMAADSERMYHEREDYLKENAHLKDSIGDLQGELLRCNEDCDYEVSRLNRIINK
jgi:hypothetical protein